MIKDHVKPPDREDLRVAAVHALHLLWVEKKGGDRCMHEKCAIGPFMVKTSVLTEEGWWGQVVEGDCSDLPCSEGSGNTVFTMGLSKTDQST
ncbi:hypothetical protein PMIT1306_00731 [Prochlorococcus sp. MIT 1306]|nr:hypothetical protein PMIT1306_00731 [Prochlorococcus sp. MIT 1306]